MRRVPGLRNQRLPHTVVEMTYSEKMLINPAMASSAKPNIACGTVGRSIPTTTG